MLIILPQHRSSPEITLRIVEDYTSDIPLSNAVVSLQEEGLEKKTNDDGLVLFDDDCLQPDTDVLFSISCENYYDKQVKVHTVGGKQFVTVRLERSVPVGQIIPNVSCKALDKELLSKLEGIKVKLTNKGTGEEQTRTTGSAGGCNFKDIVEDDYTINLSNENYNSVEEDVSLRINHCDLIYYLLNKLISQVTLHCVDEKSRIGMQYIGVRLESENTNYFADTITDENSNAIFNNVPEGNYYVTLTSDYIEPYYELHSFSKSKFYDEAKYHQVILPNAEVTVLDNNLKTPIFEADVGLLSDEEVKYEGQTNIDGKVLLHNVLIGDYDVKSTYEDYYDTILNEVTFDVANPNHTIYMQDKRISEVSIKCLSQSKRKPIKNVEVTISSDDEEPITAVTDDEGIAKFQHLYEGTYHISTESDLFKEYDNSITFNKAQTKPYEILLEQDVLESINITVKDDVTYEVVHNALIFGVNSDNKKIEGVTDENGVCTFELVPISTFNMLVSAEDCDNKEEVLDFNTNRSDYTILIHNPIIPVAELKVIDELYLKACKECNVSVFNKDDTEEVLYEGVTNDEGIINLEKIHEGDYSVLINNDYVGSHSEIFSLSRSRPNKTFKVKWHYVTIGWILVGDSTDGTIHIEDATVSLQEDNDINPRTGVTDEYGLVIFENIRCGHYTINCSVDNEHYISKESRIDVPYQEKLDINILLEPNIIPVSEIEVRDETTDMPLSDVNIKVTDEDEYVDEEATTGKDGKGKIIDLPVGYYDVDLSGGIIDDQIPDK